MTQTLALESQSIALELHRVLMELDPARWRNETQAARRKRLRGLEKRLSKLLERAKSARGEEALSKRLRELGSLLREMPSTQLSGAEIREQWMRHRGRLQGSYTKLATLLHLRSIKVPRLRPSNWKRSLSHAGAGFLILSLLSILDPKLLILMASVLLVYAWGMEGIRRISPEFNARLMRIYGPLAHAHEHKELNSATWYCSALFLLSLLQMPLVAAVGVMILGIADPMAGLVGRRYGRHRLIHGRSLEGSLTFFGVAVLVSLSVLQFSELSLSEALIASFFAALPATLAELFSKRLDDNLTVPLAAAAGLLLFKFLL